MTDLTPISNPLPEWFPPPFGLTEIKQEFGYITVRDGVIVTPKWEHENMVMMEDIPGYPGKRLYVNKKVEPILRETLRQCVALNDGYVIKKLGCFNPRVKTANEELSTHSWGIAIDLNSDENPFQRIRKREDLAKRKKDIPDAWIAIFKAIGWTWGGDFSSSYDPMHFQFCSGY